MPSRTRIAESPPAAVPDALERLGRNVRIARLRRRLTQEELGQRVGVSRFVIADVEKGKATTGVAAHLGALWALGLLSRMQEVGDPDRDDEGKALERARMPGRARRPQRLADDF